MCFFYSSLTLYLIISVHGCIRMLSTSGCMYMFCHSNFSFPIALYCFSQTQNMLFVLMCVHLLQCYSPSNCSIQQRSSHRTLKYIFGSIFQFDFVNVVVVAAVVVDVSARDSELFSGSNAYVIGRFRRHSATFFFTMFTLSKPIMSHTHAQK